MSETPRFTRHPERVVAFQMTTEARKDTATWPDWLRARWNAAAQDADAVWGRVPDAIVVVSKRGDLRVLDNDWIVSANTGLLVVDDAHFRSNYTESTGVARMATARRRISVGEMVTLDDVVFEWDADAQKR
jgi:hypothetical protein